MPPGRDSVEEHDAVVAVVGALGEGRPPEEVVGEVGRVEVEVAHVPLPEGLLHVLLVLGPAAEVRVPPGVDRGVRRGQGERDAEGRVGVVEDLDLVGDLGRRHLAVDAVGDDVHVDVDGRRRERGCRGGGVDRLALGIAGEALGGEGGPEGGLVGPGLLEGQLVGVLGGAGAAARDVTRHAVGRDRRVGGDGSGRGRGGWHRGTDDAEGEGSEEGQGA